MLHRLYHRVLLLAAGRHAPLWLALVAAAEASFFPVPPDALLIPMALARPDRAIRYPPICTAASVVGGMGGYLIGYALFAQLAQPLLHLYGYGERYAEFQALFAEYGLRIILVKGLLPNPYKIVTIACGAAQFPFATFVAASVVTRGLRFVLWAVLLKLFGEQARVFIDRRLPVVVAVGVVATVLGFVMLRYV